MDETRLNVGQIEAVLFGFKDIKEDVNVSVSKVCQVLVLNI